MSSLDEVLEKCLTGLTSGEVTLEDCLATYPEHAGELRRLLTAATYLERGRATQPLPTFKARTRAKLIVHVNANPRGWPGRARLKNLSGQLRRVFGKAVNLAVSLAIMLLLFLFTGSVLAQTALPGDALYNWRIATEEVWQAFHPDPVSAALTLAKRHAEDIVRVAGSDPQVEQRALQDYQRVLDDLSYYTDDSSPEISRSLVQQKANLEEFEVDVPKLDKLLEIVQPKTSLSLNYEAVTVESGRITYRLTLTNEGPAAPVTAVLTNTLSPAEEFVSTSDPGCVPSNAGRVTCTVADLLINTPHNLTLTTAINPCYTGVITNTATIIAADNVTNTNPNNHAVAERTVTPPFPGPARIVYVQSNGSRHDLVGLVNAPAPPLIDNLHTYAGAPAWSPDGTKLAFFGEEGISILDGVYRQGNGIWVVDIIEGQIANPRLIVAQDHIKNIVWSPDGTKIAYEVGSPGLTHEIVVVDPRDGRQISSFSGEQPAWSADSKKLAIKGCDPGCGLWQINFDGSGAKQITFGDSDSYPAWSPTGQDLVFTSNRDGNWEIYRLHPDDKQPVRLTDRPGSDITPVFGPCGQEIYLRTDHYGGWRITVMKLDGSNEITVAEGVGATDEWGLARPAVH